MSRAIAGPILTAESGIDHYFKEIQRFPMLDRQQEYMLAKRWREDGNRDAAHRLITSHLRLVAKIARGYRGYGLPLADLISEGHVGLLQAVERFEPERGFRFSAYGVWWIKAAIQEYILRSWSLVKMGNYGQSQETVLQPAQGEEPHFCARRRRHAPGSSQAHCQAPGRHRARRDREMHYPLCLAHLSRATGASSRAGAWRTTRSRSPT